MSTAPKRNESEITQTILDMIEGVARFLMWAGIVASAVSLGFLIYYAVLFSGSSTVAATEQAKGLVETFRKVLTGGLLGAFVGSAYLFWGAGWLGAVQVVIAAFCCTAPITFPLAMGSGNINPMTLFALAGLQRAGYGAAVVAVGVLLVDMFIKVQQRLQQGTKADQLKYGKGIKEEDDRKNVFLGKCYQLPYCRKFVRERCPIYHAKRSCWREKVGCMCEEEVIKGAMENRAIPKDMVAAARYIPVNNKLTLGQKMERCRQCVIYNEHQKHKYRAALPVVLIAFTAGMALGWNHLMGLMHDLVAAVQAVIDKATIHGLQKVVVPELFQQIMLLCLAMIAVAYALKLLEFLIFKLKV